MYDSPVFRFLEAGFFFPFCSASAEASDISSEVEVNIHD